MTKPKIIYWCEPLSEEEGMDGFTYLPKKCLNYRESKCLYCDLNFAPPIECSAYEYHLEGLWLSRQKNKQKRDKGKNK